MIYEQGLYERGKYRLKKILVWDLPTRLFHWLLVIAFIISVYTGLTGGYTQMEWHMMSGAFILGLLIFRLIWGFAGHIYSRFTWFTKGPATILNYIQAHDKTAMNQPGHNPLGALSVLAMLILLLGQAATGLFSNDDIMTEGPLAHLVSYETSRVLTDYHKLGFLILSLLVSSHLAAIAWYSLIKKRTLIQPMITGQAFAPEDLPSHPYRKRYLEFIVASAFSALLVYSLINWI